MLILTADDIQSTANEGRVEAMKEAYASLRRDRCCAASSAFTNPRTQCTQLVVPT
jgi:hypothetical protein